MIYFPFPETAGFTLEAVDLAFMDKGKGSVKKADELWQVIKQGGQIGLRGETAHKKMDVEMIQEVNL
jgi:hypothetical protein